MRKRVFVIVDRHKVVIEKDGDDIKLLWTHDGHKLTVKPGDILYQFWLNKYTHEGYEI